MTEKRFNACLDQFRCGDNSGFEEIFKEYSSKVYGEALLITKNVVWAEEVVSILFSDFLKQAQNPTMYVEEPDGYIFVAAANIAKKTKFKEEFRKTVLTDNIAIKDSLSDHIDYVLDFDRSIAGLSDKHKECAIMHYVYGKTYKEIAKKFDITERAVVHYFEDIKKHLKKYFKNY